MYPGPAGKMLLRPIMEKRVTDVCSCLWGAGHCKCDRGLESFKSLRCSFTSIESELKQYVGANGLPLSSLRVTLLYILFQKKISLQRCGLKILCQ